jgi:cell division protein FtsB
MTDAPSPAAPSPAAADAPRPTGGRGWPLVRYLLVFVAVVLVIDGIVGEKGLMSLLKARRQYTAVEQALQRSRRENTQLREQARRLREDPTAIEEVARRELGLLKPGETLFIIRNAPPPKTK